MVMMAMDQRSHLRLTLQEQLPGCQCNLSQIDRIKIQIALLRRLSGSMGNWDGDKQTMASFDKSIKNPYHSAAHLLPNEFLAVDREPGRPLCSIAQCSATRIPEQATCVVVAYSPVLA